MKKQYLLIFMIKILVSQNVFAQNIASQSINNAGKTMIQSNSSICFTVGELVVLSETDTDGNSLGNGFTSGATITTTGILEPNSELLSVKVFPNPTSELVNIQINHSTLDQISISICDINGKIIYFGKYAPIANIIGININNYEFGTYMMSINNESNQVLGTYRIIKK